MSAKIFTPVNQIRFTNVAVVRLKKGGKRYEIACYKNKVVEWRKGVETDVDEVLQISAIFTNVSKGVIAKRKDLKKAFGNMNEMNIIYEILKKGQFQVSGEERKKEMDSQFRDIATIVVEKCVNSQTNRPVTIGYVVKCMKNIHYSVNTSKNTKRQALDVIKLFEKQKEFSIIRAKMRIRFSVPLNEWETENDETENPLQTKFKQLIFLIEKIETENEKNIIQISGLIIPKDFREIDNLIKTATEGKGNLEVLVYAVKKEDDNIIQ